MRELQPTAAPVRGFLDWPVATDPNEWSADVALLGIQHSEPYAHDPRPNDQARAPDAIRLRSEQISYGRDQWDFDLDTPLAALLPRCIDMGNVAWSGGSYDDYSAAISGRDGPRVSCRCASRLARGSWRCAPWLFEPAALGEQQTTG